MRFLALCDQYGSQHLAVKLVASGRNTGVPGLPETDDWTAWDADQMRAAIEHLVSCIRSCFAAAGCS